MFDNIHFENDIPDPHLRDKEWQTKSLENALLKYRVTAEGELIVKREKYEFVEAPEHLFGFQQNVVDEWEEKVEHHGIVEAYCFQRREDGSAHSVTYDLYFSYGQLDRLERREEEYPAPRPIERNEDPTPMTETQVGDYTLHLPESIEVTHATQQGELLLLRLAYPGVLNIKHANHGTPTQSVNVTGRLTPRRIHDENEPPQPLVDSKGRIEHAAGVPIQLLTEHSRPAYVRGHPYFGPADLIAVIAPADLLGD